MHAWCDQHGSVLIDLQWERSVRCSLGGLSPTSPYLQLLVQASFVGAMAIADLVKSTLGPKGMVRTDGGLGEL